MKRLILISTLLTACITNASAQSSAQRAQELMKQSQQKPGSFTADVNGKKVNEKAIVIKLANNKGFLITNEIITGDPGKIFTVKLPEIKAGKYAMKKNENMVSAGGMMYEMRDGEIIVQEKGGKLSGSFSGNLFSLNKSKSKFDAPAGKVSGTFSGLTKP